MINEKLSNEAHNPPLRKGVVSGSISVSKGRAERYRQVYSNSKWFDDCEWYVFIDDGECLTIKKCYGIEIPKKAMKISKAKEFQFVSELPINHFEFDCEESNCDVARIYYR